VKQTYRLRPLSQDGINWKARYLARKARLARTDPRGAADRAWLGQYMSTPLVREELDRIHESLPEGDRPKYTLSYNPWYRTQVMGEALLPSMR